MGSIQWQSKRLDETKEMAFDTILSHVKEFELRNFQAPFQT